MKRTAATDHYATLQVSRNASPEAVRRAWRKLAQKYHPDRHRGAGDAAARMAQINVAYGVLSDAQLRAAYDSSLASASLPGGTAQAARGMPAAVQDKPGWSWALLVAVLSVTLLTLGLVALRTQAPLTAPVIPPTAAVPPQRIADSEPLVPATPVRPWTEPPRRQAVTSPETEPVARLVRDGTLSATVRQRNGAAAP